MALAPEELELDPMAMTQKYEEHVREQQAQVEKEDFSDMVAEHAAKQKVGVPSGGEWPRGMGKDGEGQAPGTVASWHQGDSGEVGRSPGLPGCVRGPTSFWGSWGSVGAKRVLTCFFSLLQQKKRKAQPQDSRGGSKKYKEFKF